MRYAPRVRLACCVAGLLIGCGSPEPLEPLARPQTPVAMSMPSSSAPSSSAPASSPVAPPGSGSAAVAPAPLPAAVADDGPPPLPSGFVAIPQPFDEGLKPIRCGNLQVENVRDDEKVFEPFVVVTDSTTGKKIYEAHGRRIEYEPGTVSHMSLAADVCGDLTGDGIAELILTERTLGAHCCYTHYVASLTSPSKLIMTWEKGDAGHGVWPVKLKPGKAWQLESVDLVWPPFKVAEGDPPVPYSGVPGFPIVFDRVGDTYQKRTFAFLDGLRKERDEARAACAKRPGCEPDELREWGMALLFDEWDRDQAQIIPDAALRSVLDKRAKAMKALLRTQLGG